MFKKALIFVAITFLPTAALAQTADPELIQKILPSLQAQRNNALDAVAVAEGRLALANDQLTKANAKIKELEDKLNPPKDEKKK